MNQGLGEYLGELIRAELIYKEETPAYMLESFISLARRYQY